MKSSKMGAVRLIPCADYDIEGLQSAIYENGGKGANLRGRHICALCCL